MQEMTIREISPKDREQWEKLYAEYAGFYGVDQTAEMRDRVWSWLHDAQHEVSGLVAEDGNSIVGLAHFRPFARPLAAQTGGFLDDLFVAPQMRGRRVADALIEAVAEEGRRRGWSLIRWITKEDNYRARGVYDRLALRTDWVTYDLNIV